MFVSQLFQSSTDPFSLQVLCPMHSHCRSRCTSSSCSFQRQGRAARCVRPVSVLHGGRASDGQPFSVGALRVRRRRRSANDHRCATCGRAATLFLVGRASARNPCGAWSCRIRSPHAPPTRSGGGFSVRGPWCAWRHVRLVWRRQRSSAGKLRRGGVLSASSHILRQRTQLRGGALLWITMLLS